MGIYIAIVVALIIVVLVVRDQSEVRLRKMRSELMAMRSHEQHLHTEKAEVQQLISWVTESLKRATDRQETAQNACRDLHDLLTDTGIHVEPITLEVPEEETSS